MSMQGFSKSEIIRILAGQLSTVAAMADLLEAVMSMQGFAESEIIRILAGQLSTVAAMADLAENNHPYPWVAMERYDRENVVLDDFTPMLTPESNSDVTSPRSNNLSTSNHVSLDSRQ
ncbi:hypothetical protein Tco_1214483 [Tanacetum coccineum]